MDTIGLRAAWVSTFSFLLANGVAGVMHFPTPAFQSWWAGTAPFRARRRMLQLTADIETSETPDASYMSDLIAFYGAAIPHLIAGQYAKRR